MITPGRGRCILPEHRSDGSQPGIRYAGQHKYAPRASEVTGWLAKVGQRAVISSPATPAALAASVTTASEDLEKALCDHVLGAIAEGMTRDRVIATLRKFADGFAASAESDAAECGEFGAHPMAGAIGCQCGTHTPDMLA
jgi:hypothetical protein